jgi:hypothetical protein
MVDPPDTPAAGPAVRSKYNQIQMLNRLAPTHPSANGPSHTDAMEATMTKHEANQQQSLNLFLARKAEFDRMVSELQQMSADHFGADPEAVLWCEAADLERRNQLLREITDAYFRRGEFAA